MGRFNGRNNAFCAAHIFKSLHRFIIGNSNIFRTSVVIKHSMFRSDSRIIQTGRNRVNRCNLTKFILTEIRFHTVENARPPCCDRCCRFRCIHAPACRFTSNQSHILIFNKMIKGTDGIGTAAHAGQNRIRQFAFRFKNLLFDLFGNHCLKISDNRRKRMRPHDRAQHIMRIINSADPFAECL